MCGGEGGETASCGTALQDDGSRSQCWGPQAHQLGSEEWLGLQSPPGPEPGLLPRAIKVCARAHLPGLLHSLLGVTLHLVAGMVGDLSHWLLEDGCCLPDWEGRVQVRLSLWRWDGAGPQRAFLSVRKLCSRASGSPVDPPASLNQRQCYAQAWVDVLPLVSLVGGCGHTPAPSCLMVPFSAEHGPGALSHLCPAIRAGAKVPEHLFTGDL